MKIAIAQLNPIVGDIAGNTVLVTDAIALAQRDGADMLITSELLLTGYPPRDLLLREGIVEACEAAVQHIAHMAKDMWVIVGHPRQCQGGIRSLRNSASVCRQGQVLAVCDKQLLPGYDVFDEDRYFEPGGRSLIIEIANRRVGIVICEDLWRANDVLAERHYAVEPVAELMAQECELIVSLNASPFVVGKWQRHIQQLKEIAIDNRMPIVVVNQVGANDDLIFDGRSVAMNADGSLHTVLPGFEACVRTIDLSFHAPENHVWHSQYVHGEASVQLWDDPLQELFSALTLGVRDYCWKTKHAAVLIGLSGGIDSALTGAIAAAALGPQNVHGVMMPSRYSSAGSIDDSIELSDRLGLTVCREASIHAVHRAVQETIRPHLGEQCATGVTNENVQARLRGVLLMAMSNATGALVLATSNKSEIATGYSTLYGDMCGAIAVLGDVTKSTIYKLARWINTHHAACGFAQPPIPENSIAKPPSAELRPNQTDQDSLPPYHVLDEIIERYVEREQSAMTIIQQTGFEEALVLRTLSMIDRAQYKRDQAPIVLKVTGRAFGRGRPMPIVMKQTLVTNAHTRETLPHAITSSVCPSLK